MINIPAFAPRLACTAALLLGVLTGATRAAQVDLSLNVFYSDDSDPSSGGTWQVAAKTDEFGLVDVFFNLRNIKFDSPADIVNLAPNGTVNAGADYAGFMKNAANRSTHVFMGVLQPSAAAPTTDQSHFYGVGSIIDPEGATPNYPDQPTDFPDATAIGPVRSTLENLNNPLWGDGDPLGDSDWDHAAIILSGTFQPGQSPAFFSTGTQMPQGRVFLNAPAGATAIGTVSDPITPTTVVRTNLAVPTADYGDYNGDGIVNLADYTVWRNTLGATAAPAGSGADGDLSGTIDAGDYDVWKMNFGLPATPVVSGSLVSAPVPEPQTITLLAFTCIAGCFFRRWGFSSRGKNDRLCDILLKKL